MWPRPRPSVFMPVPLQCERPAIEKISALRLGQAKTHGYNERLSRINLYAPAHNKPFPFKSSQKESLLG
jgi:hypothetical protein